MTELVAQIEQARTMASEVDAEGRLMARFCFPDTFIGFEGHFPGFPVLPAVIQMRVGQLLAEELHQSPLRLSAVEKSKFLQQIGPKQDIDALCRKGKVSGQEAYEVQLTVEGKVAAKFWLVPQQEQM